MHISPAVSSLLKIQSDIVCNLLQILKPEHFIIVILVIIAWPVTILFSCTVCECGLVLEGGQRIVVQVVLQLICQAAFPGRRRRSEVYHPDIPRDKQAARAPTARPQIQQAFALLTFTVQCLSYPCYPPFFFFLFSSSSRLLKPTTL